MVAENEQMQHPFADEIEALATVQQTILQAAHEHGGPEAAGMHNMARQALDQLNLAYLLVSSFGTYLAMRDQAVDAEVQAGNVMTMPGEAGNGS